MEPLFRLMLIRPAVASDPDRPSIEITQDSPFQNELAAAAATGVSRAALQRIARSFVAGGSFLGDPDDTPRSSELAALATALDRLERRARVSHAEVAAAVEEAFGDSPQVVAGSEDLNDAMRWLRDSLLAIKHLQEAHGRPIEALARQLRDLELILKVAGDEGFPATAAELRRYRRRSFRTPPAENLRSVLSTAELEEQRRKQLAEAEEARRQRAEAVLDRHRRLRRAIDELTRLGGEHFQLTPLEAHAGTVPPPELTPTGVLSRRTAFLGSLFDLNLKQLETALGGGGEVDPLRLQDIAGATSAVTLAERVLADSPGLLAGSPAFRPPAPVDVGFRLRPGTVEILSPSTREQLAELGLSVGDRPLDRLVESLQAELDGAFAELEVLYGRPVRQSVQRLGDTLVTISTPVVSAWTSLAVGTGFFPLPELPAAGRVPQSRGRVAPAGVADLLVVRQQLVRYEGADVAHIENVLRGERKRREHTRRQETEQITFRETEVTVSEERELESTSRFEMMRETQATIREDAALKAGLTVSGQYGPTVEFSASAEGSVSRSKEEATRAASSFSQEITERSANKITERVLERATLRVTHEVTERNAHELDNVAGADHVSGVYQWVNKVYQAQMYNYGLRMMFDFMIPEPAAFLMEVLKSSHASATELEKPPEFILQPSGVTEFNYGYWVRLYGATDVVPPPEMYKTKSIDFKAGGGDSKTNYNHSAQITIDEGYRAVQGCVAVVWNLWTNDCSIDLALGRKVRRIRSTDSWVWITPLDDERDSIPFALDTLRVAQVAAAVEVKCQRTDRALEKWRLDTHAKLTNAYRARLAEYEERLAALKLQAGVAIEGKNPAANLEAMKDELKKGCISILTDQHYDLFDAIDLAASNGLPQIDVPEAEAEGAYVRFFEQAFEWEQMTWVTYPYFWGRKSQWDERLAFDDPDPLFNQFLKAGYCRVSVPARPGFEGAIDHFMTHGELWMGGPLPPITSPLYLPIADEIAERLDRPGDEVPQGEPWRVRIPTTLVRLRPDDQLPRWTRDASGDWVEEE